MMHKPLWLLLLAIPLFGGFSISVSAAGGRHSAMQPAPDPSCSSVSPCLEWQNVATGTAIEGSASNGIGLFGTSTSSFGVKGVSTSSTGVEGSSTTLYGVFGSSSSYDGVFGQTLFNAISGPSGKAGVFGLDASTSGRFDSGVEGLSVNGVGVRAFSTSNNAVYANSSGFDSIHSVTTNDSKTSKTGRSGVLGQDTSSDGGRLNAGVTGTSVNGLGVVGKSSFIGVNAVGGDGGFPALSIVGDSTKPELILACQTKNPCDQRDFVFAVSYGGDGNFQGSLDVAHGILTTDVEAATGDFFNGLAVGSASVPGSGDINIQGQYLISGGCVLGCAAASARAPGRAVTSYATQETSPTIEDFGEAQLVNGQAYVALGADFANIIDRRTNYLVFITPDGPNHGLYVTQKTIRGFVVRENPGSQSTLTFDYRIVARRYGDASPRLPMTELRPKSSFGGY